MADKYRAPSGEPTAEAREKFSVFGDKSYPIWDKESAVSAIDKRGFLKSSVKRKKVLDAAAKYAPAEAKAARQDDLNA